MSGPIRFGVADVPGTARATGAPPRLAIPPPPAAADGQITWSPVVLGAEMGANPPAFPPSR